VHAQNNDIRVIIDYASYNAQGELSVLRTITIRSVSAQKVTAYCHLRQDERTFRIGRIRRVLETEEAVTAPPNHPS
jgi:predicted DNA-binding transcriptional regulator YafY